MIIVTTLSAESQNSSWSEIVVSAGVNEDTNDASYLSIRTYMHEIYSNEEDQEEERDQPRVTICPVCQNDLGGGQVPCDGDSVVECIVPSDALPINPNLVIGTEGSNTGGLTNPKASSTNRVLYVVKEPARGYSVAISLKLRSTLAIMAK